MSDDLADIHAQTSAILEKLYDQKGQPADLDEDFVQEYFKLVQGNIKLDEEDIEVAALGPHKADAKLSQQGQGLIDVLIPSKSEKFQVSLLESVKTLRGTSQRIGSSRGKGTYLMTSVKGIPSITIKSGSAVVTCVFTPNTVKTESGKGEWVKV